MTLADDSILSSLITYQPRKKLTMAARLMPTLGKQVYEDMSNRKATIKILLKN